MFYSGSTRKCGLSWLDRIRTAKSFPENGACDLENFIQKSATPDPETSNRCPTSVPIFAPNRNEDKQIFTVMSDVLHELFNFGDNSGDSVNFKKSARKQANPRICAFPNNGSDVNINAPSEKATVLRSGDNNSGVEGVKELDKRRNEGGDDGRDWNLPGFSRTEVTVIDTSYECWKFEKMLFRRKNVWKVRDKKGKSENVVSKKKRKGSLETQDHGCKGKKPKVHIKEGCTEMARLQGNEGNHQSDAHENVPEKVSKVLKKKQEDTKSENGSSSIILIKSMPASKKNETSFSKSCPRIET